MTTQKIAPDFWKSQLKTNQKKPQPIRALKHLPPTATSFSAAQAGPVHDF